MVSALSNGFIDLSVKIIHALHNCPLDVRAANLRAVLNTELGKNVILREGHRILQWMDESGTGWQFNRLIK